jgi:hypothetical protein
MQRINITLPYELKASAEEMSEKKAALLHKLINEGLKDFFEKNKEPEIDLLLRDVSICTRIVHNDPLSD